MSGNIEKTNLTGNVSVTPLCGLSAYKQPAENFPYIFQDGDGFLFQDGDRYIFQGR